MIIETKEYKELKDKIYDVECMLHHRINLLEHKLKLSDAIYNKIYIVEWQRREGRLEGQCYIKDQEFYTSEATANKRRNDLEYENTHRWDDDTQTVVPYTIPERIDNGEYYNFVVKEVVLKDYKPEELPIIRIS